MHDAPAPENASTSPPFGPGGRWLFAACKYAAIAGGLVFVAMVAMEIVSIVGRKLFSWTVPGDVEILQMGAAVASATFFAWCHMVGGNVKVDFFTHNLKRHKVAWLDAVGSTLVGLFGALIAWRAAAGAWAVKDVGETSAILGWPVWIAQVLMVPSFVLLAVAGFYLAFQHAAVALRARGEARG
jgi:TRAP-type mannitol/chloroaromatic compound transport system permease small subunit